ncbi:hypothetical protein [Halarcobacter bivalviorum]|uniref:DUF481 domain-containing protein n=1 Tax=Halarcobacter bivalviorum TaxID=663364 RepID=A0AAX2AAF5_9BACT|nr:hypothetical protein [Halarcobacter bivalviorum]AXH12139.1 hypothetical protein ABIV_1136 [Halarcobacter bivalviorum]RXK11247.1 hypothetical protein CRV05_02445 [Halarcobacter bivalviorum]
MKKSIIFFFLLSVISYANNSSISYEYGVKDYKNSMTKKDGNVKTVGISHKVSNHKIDLSYQGDNVIREHSLSKVNLKSLDVEKYSIKYNYKINDSFALKTSYIKIIDNLAPTDQGKVYGLGGTYQFSKGLSTSLSAYKSDYKDFDVKQYDFAISKGFKIKDIKLKATALAKKIDIDGKTYGNYVFKDKDYFTTGIKFAASYQSYVAGVGAFFGKRIFTVLDDGTKVQHHAMQQDKTYMLSFGKKFKNFDIIAKYSFQNGKELPENRDDVDTKVMALSLMYKF